jgi:uncharacterized membrane-anchored protein YhcB (DUF1043 family)
MNPEVCPAHSEMLTKRDAAWLAAALGVVAGLIVTIVLAMRPAVASADRVAGVEARQEIAESRLQRLEQKIDRLPARIVEMLDRDRERDR